MSTAAAVKLEPRPVEIAADGMVPLSDLAGAFGTPRSARRWAAELPGYLRDKRAGEWYVHADARLPDGGQVLGFLKCGAEPERYAGQRLPPGSDQWTQKGWDHLDNLLELRRRYDETRAKFPTASKERLAKLFGQEHGGWGANCRPYRLSCKRKALDRYFRRIDPHDPLFDGGVDRRGRKTVDGQVAGCSREAWDYFKVLYLDPRRRKIALCWEIVSVEAEKNGWAWPGLRTIQKRVKAELPPFIADYHRLGPQRWARKHAPRIERDLSQTQANQVWIGDHAKFDFLCLVGGKPIRPWITAWMDQRSRLLVGWKITAGPDSDTILAAFGEAVLEHGAPLHVIIDNGKDYRAKGFSGGRRGKPRLDEERVKSVLGRLDIRVTFCEPFNPGSKAIERLFGTMHNRFDRLFDSYSGSEPKERPEDLYRRLKAGRVSVPTLDEVRAKFAEWVEAYHDRPHSGDSMERRSPRWVFEHCDPLPKRTAPADVLAELLKKTVKVKVSRRGVRYNGVYYGQGELQLRPLHGCEVLLAIDLDHAEHVDVRALDGRHICRAYEQRLTGLSRDDIKANKRRQKRARELVKRMGPAYRDARKTVVELAIDAQAKRSEQLRKAAGAETDPAPPRGMALLPGAADVMRNGLPGADVGPVHDQTLEFEEDRDAGDGAPVLDYGNTEEQQDEPTVGDLLGRLEFDDE